MSATSDALKANSDQGKDSLIGYFPIGYPSLEASIEAAVAMCEEGVDVLELGVPYSDPVMDGVVIQEATQEALQNGFKLRSLFPALKQITSRVDTPILVMTYWNPVLQYGVENFASDLKDAGGAGLITPDLIPDEAIAWLEQSDKHELDRVFLATPTSTQERVDTATRLSRGFVYAVSTMGITGERQEVDQSARQVVASVRAANADQNVAVGIGISTATQASQVNDYADGAIVGSVFVKAYQQGGIEALREKVREIVEGLKR